MARDFDARERADAARSNRIRNSFMDAGSQPFGDKAINPKAKRTAHDYYRWMRNRPSSIHRDAGSYLGMLEREEHILGTTSYPEGHPRREHVEAGRYYPQGLPLPPEAQRRPQESPADELRKSASAALTGKQRVNTVGGTCVGCGNSVGPGEGYIVRRSSGYGVVHQNES